VTEPTQAVFLSYASEDAPAVQRTAEALRAAGIEVWFDCDELRGEMPGTAAFGSKSTNVGVPVISAQTEAREEGYFRREWALAVDRTRDMAEKRAFLVPVVIDGTTERSASVPEKFLAVQWTRLPGGETTVAFVERLRRLLAPDSALAHPAAAVSSPISTTVQSTKRSVSAWRHEAVVWAMAALAAQGLGYFAVDRFWIAKRSPAASTAAPAVSAFAPPPHSIAVLPFVNMSGDKEGEYFSEGLAEELLNSLARIKQLQVAARTSSFSFQGEHPDIATLAHKLNVGAVLEGSVRRSRAPCASQRS
jgi:TIR domain